MASWAELEGAVPELAAAVRSRIEGHLHHVLGTLTTDGSPRLSGTEARFHDGQLWLGCMPKSIKARDLRRDPRFGLHSAPVEVEMTEGDAKLSGVVAEVTDRRAITNFMIAIGHGEGLEPDTELDAGVAAAFVCDIDAMSLTRVAGDHLEVTTWTSDGGLVIRKVS